MYSKNQDQKAPAKEITITNQKPFYRKKGLPCLTCGSTAESLFIQRNEIYLMCDECHTPKGKDAFKKMT
jgi:formamidopyrimidine-DNA glycosylase